MEFLKKLRSLSETKKKIILWTTVILLTLVLFIWWINKVQKTLQNFPSTELKEHFRPPEIPPLEFPRIEIPAFEDTEISEEELQGLRQTLTDEEIEELKRFLKDGK